MHLYYYVLVRPSCSQSAAQSRSRRSCGFAVDVCGSTCLSAARARRGSSLVALGGEDVEDRWRMQVAVRLPVLAGSTARDSPCNLAPGKTRRLNTGSNKPRSAATLRYRGRPDVSDLLVDGTRPSPYYVCTLEFICIASQRAG